MTPEELVKERVHHYFWDLDIQCGRSSLLCLGELFAVEAILFGRDFVQGILESETT